MNKMEWCRAIFGLLVYWLANFVSYKLLTKVFSYYMDHMVLDKN